MLSKKENASRQGIRQNKTAHNSHATSPLGSKASPKSPLSTELPAEIRSKMENSFDHDFSDVKIHTESQVARNTNALAFASGKDVHFAPGQFAPNSKHGQQLIGHELAHVVQQSNGVPGQAFKKTLNNPASQTETEADLAGLKAAEGQKAVVKSSASPLDIQKKPAIKIDMFTRLNQGVGEWMGKRYGKARDVEIVQSCLNWLGFLVEVDGALGDKTMAAIGDYQRAYGDRESYDMITPFNTSWNIMKTRVLYGIQPGQEYSSDTGIELDTNTTLRNMHAQFDEAWSEDHVNFSAQGHHPAYSSKYVFQPDGGFYQVQNKKSINTSMENGQRELDFQKLLPVHQHLFLFPDLGLSVCFYNTLSTKDYAAVAMTATSGIDKSQKDYYKVYFEDGAFMAHGFRIGKGMADLSPAMKIHHLVSYFRDGKDSWGDNMSGLQAAGKALFLVLDLAGPAYAGYKAAKESASIAKGVVPQVTMGTHAMAAFPFATKIGSVLYSAGYITNRYAAIPFNKEAVTSSDVEGMARIARMTVDTVGGRSLHGSQ